MTVGTSIFLIVVGAILSYAITWELPVVDVAAVGVILMLAGAIGLVISVGWAFHPNRRAADPNARADLAGRPIETFGEAPPAPDWHNRDPRHGDPSYRDAGYGDTAYGNAGYGDTAYGDAGYGDAGYGDARDGDTNYLVPFDTPQSAGRRRRPTSPASEARRVVAPWYSDDGTDSTATVAGYGVTDHPVADHRDPEHRIADAVTDPGFEIDNPRPSRRPGKTTGPSGW